ncbi:nucleoside 2-deoxyribosyltransferase domain-containing protein [Lactiplantibacillus daoliensis]|uniref:Nucleoside 2-deoxyribosyltransferase domain-containing protein n=1 Tax=Lactiplantibacillus daoliensis TaxID=2559916 RepID=A0ABW1UFL8_9LACO|nr:nucleoside 2-deoxyribosyltransferase domain-containing protein [Lactiplantibacillus daoliensis]
MPKAKRFYIAGSFRKITLINSLSEDLMAKGYERTFDWTTLQATTNLQFLHDIAIQEFQAVVACDFLVFVFPGGKGANIEFGIAAALKKPIYLLDTTNQVNNPEETSTFYLMDYVHRFHGTVAAFGEFILNEEPTML